MQPILVATDFSEASGNALRFAARLSLFRQCPLVVVHAYPLPIASGEPLLMPAGIECVQHESAKALAKQEGSLRSEFPSLQAEFVNLPAPDIAAELLQYCELRKPFLLVLGTHERTEIESWFSEGLRLMHRTSVPLLMVPAGFQGIGWMRAVLAFDGAPLQPVQQHRITTIMSELHAMLDVVHVQSSRTSGPVFPQLGPVAGSNHTVLAKNVASGLQTFLQQNPSDLMVVLPHHHSLWERFFVRRHTPSLVSELPLPVLVLPES
ncbi:MAG: universal stress protein [Chitinophagaceae bacterium]|nr:MAG: universal stress protein [Chitinophagaceae bacterium]